MPGVPFFVEVIASAQSANIQLCRKIMAVLFKEKIQPLPFASCVREVAEVLAALKVRSMTPAVFVVNTFYADELLPQIDPLIGATPTVYLRRQIFSDPLAAGSLPDASRPSTTLVLRKMAARPSVEWIYGSKTADEVAAEGAKALLCFLREGDFSMLENYQRLQTAQLLQSRSDSEVSTTRRVSHAFEQDAREPASGKDPILPGVSNGQG